MLFINVIAMEIKMFTFFEFFLMGYLIWWINNGITKEVYKSKDLFIPWAGIFIGICYLHSTVAFFVFEKEFSFSLFFLDPLQKAWIFFIVFTIIVVIYRTVMKIKNSESWERGQRLKNTQIGGDFFNKLKENSRNKKSFSFGKNKKDLDEEPSYQAAPQSTKTTKPKTTQDKKESKMTQPFSPNMKKCATCALWGGDREINPTRTVVTVLQNSKGMCIGGGHNRAQVPSTGTCAKYEKLPSLK